MTTTIAIFALVMALAAIGIALRIARRNYIIREDYPDRIVFRDKDKHIINTLKK